jgi:DNA-binding transcriptional LysR family regulator
MAAFVRVVDSKGFSAAAPSLGLTPSAVSKLVTRLERRLGVRLLQRTTRALHLTEDGEVFYAAAKRIVAEIETLENQIAGQSGNPHGVLRVTTSLAFSTHQLTPVLPEFLARHPLIELDLLPTDRVIDMVEEGVDIAIRIGRLADTSFMARKIGEDKRLICAAPAYLARHGTPRRPADLGRGTIASCRANAPISIAGRLGSTARSARSRSPAGSPSTRARCRCSLPCRASASCG